MKILDKYRTLILILLIVQTAFLRYLWFLIHPENPVWDEHFLIANQLYNGAGFKMHEALGPTAWRMPVYPFYLYFLYVIGGGLNEYFIVFWQCIIDAMIAGMIYLVANKLFNNVKISILSVLLWSIYIPSYNYSIRTYAEPLSSLFLLLHVYYFILGEKTLKKKYYVLSGIGIGMATLTRPIYFYLVFLVSFFIVFVHRRNWLEYVQKVSIVLITFSLLMAPWIIRNYLLFQKVVPTTTLGGSGLHYFNYIDKYKTPDGSRKIFLDALATGGKYSLGGPISLEYSEAELDRVLMKEAKQFILDYPFHFIINSIKRFLHFWFNYNGWENRKITFLDVAFVSANLLFIISGILTYYWNRQNPKYLYVIYLIILSKTFLHTLTVATPRYCLPLWPYCIIFTSYAIVCIEAKINKKYISV